MTCERVIAAPTDLYFENNKKEGIFPKNLQRKNVLPIVFTSNRKFKETTSSNYKYFEYSARTISWTPTKLYLPNGLDLRPELYRVSYRPYLRIVLLKKFGYQVNFIAHFC